MTHAQLSVEIEALKQKIQELEAYLTVQDPLGESGEQNELRFRSLLEATSDCLWEIDLDGRFTFLSENIGDLLGYPVSELIGKTPFVFMRPAELGRITKLYAGIVQSRQAFSAVETISLHRDGHEVITETSGVPVLNAQGEFIGYFGFSRDISERRLAEEALRANRLHLAEAMELAHIVYWEMDPVGAVFRFNDPFYAFLATSAEQEGGYEMTMAEYTSRFMHPDDRPRLERCIEENAVRPEREWIVCFEHRLIRRDGQQRYVLTRVRAIKDETGRLLRLYGANQGISKRKQAELERERLIAELKEALAQVKTLSGLLPVCSSCKKIRDEAGNWQAMEVYIRQHSQARFTHGFCPECLRRLYPDFDSDPE